VERDGQAAGFLAASHVLDFDFLPGVGGTEYDVSGAIHRGESSPEKLGRIHAFIHKERREDLLPVIFLSRRFYLGQD
jgi:hypothetical protein